jgi:nitrous oxide reductase accessory protein NosL
MKGDPMEKRWKQISVFAAWSFLSVLLACGGEAKPDTICQLCGMDAAESETEFVLHRKAEASLHACCINCARRIMKKLGDEITEVTTLDYRTRAQVPAEAAFFVIGSKRIPKGSMTPFVFAFGSQEEAEKFSKRYGGDTLAFDEVLAKLEKKNQ